MFFFQQGRKTSFLNAFRERTIRAEPESSGRKVRRKLLIEMNGHWIAAKDEVLESELASWSTFGDLGDLCMVQ